MRSQMVKGYLKQLTASFGRRPPIDEEELLRLFKGKEYPAMVAWVRKQLGIQCRIRVGIVRSGGFSSPAWIELVEHMPMSGSSDFRNLLVTMYMRRDFLDNAPFEQVVIVIAHELSHIVLESVCHTLRHEEEAVDLTAMLLGYRDFYITGAQARLQNSSTGLRGILGTLFGGVLDQEEVGKVQRVGYLSQMEVHHAAKLMTSE